MCPLEYLYRGEVCVIWGISVRDASVWSVRIDAEKSCCATCWLNTLINDVENRGHWNEVFSWVPIGPVDWPLWYSLLFTFSRRAGFEWIALSRGRARPSLCPLWPSSWSISADRQQDQWHSSSHGMKYLTGWWMFQWRVRSFEGKINNMADRLLNVHPEGTQWSSERDCLSSLNVS